MLLGWIEASVCPPPSAAAYVGGTWVLLAARKAAVGRAGARGSGGIFVNASRFLIVYLQPTRSTVTLFDTFAMSAISALAAAQSFGIFILDPSPVLQGIV